MSSPSAPAAADWQEAGRRPRQPRGQRWRRLLWSMIYPPQVRPHRVAPTMTGGVLIGVALGIGLAAYNTASNILFITLSLLLSSLILSGLLSWINVRRVGWRLQALAPWRAGQEQLVLLDLRNRKRFVPTYGLWFDLALARTAQKTRLKLRTRLDAGGGERLEWTVRPERRGVERVELHGLGSLFPFGFLRKTMGCGQRCEVVVWPAPVEYRRLAAGGVWRSQPGERSRRPGQGGDLMALRKYASGDSQRLVHWKASARLRRLMVRQFAAESQDGFTLWFETAAARWTRPAQFELAVGLAATLAEDLFREGRLRALALDADPVTPVRTLGDLERFLDRLAVAAPREDLKKGGAAGLAASRFGSNLLTIAPDGVRSVSAYIDGKAAATA
ncbi:MAG: DUF58 domain-containing protein [Verrucomicrobiota bacterium]